MNMGGKMNKLDDLREIKNIDPAGMLDIEEKFPDQLTGAKGIISRTDLGSLKGKKYSGLAILGMGGSGFAGDIIKSLVSDEIDIPVEVVKGYSLPAFIGKNWLVMAVSYSGNTEETISAAKQAAERGAGLLIECSGGKLEETARESGYGLIKIPSGLQPRGAIGYIFYPAYLALGILGLIRLKEDDHEETLELVREKSVLYNRNNPAGENPAKKLALDIGEDLPVVYGAEGIYSALAYRLKCEINENGKTPCWWHNFSELNHNETVGWQRLVNITRNLVIITFRDPDEDVRMKTRIEVTLGQIRENVDKVVQIPVEGRSKLARAVSTMYLGDIASVYLAILAGVDPTPVVKIESLKKKLAELN
jgi:glucose/mannose-6-phosphate isomerase